MEAMLRPDTWEMLTTGAMGSSLSTLDWILDADLVEAIVRDLWALRLSKLLHRHESPQPGGSGSKAFSSVGESGDDDDSRMSRKRTGEGGDFPKLIETIALCYMGILLLRLPIGLHELYR